MQSETSFRIFVVEDDPVVKRLVTYIMSQNPDHEVHAFDSGKECIQHLHLKPQLISLDYKLPDISGYKVFQQIKKQLPYCRVIILSAQKEIETAVSLLKEGASDYIAKGTGMRERLMNSIRLLKQNIELEEEVGVLKQELSSQYNLAGIVGLSQPMQEVYELIRKAIDTNISVSIIGETGTGKEVVAKSIHHNSKRRDNRFVAINMAAIPSELLESELFGHEKGAFTGAIGTKAGKFEVADGGTLFLDEIGDMDKTLQAKLLRALQEKEVTRVGGNKPIKFDARIIVATHQDLTELVKKGDFRQDLYYRLLGLTIPLPPLRNRGMDVLLLAKHFLKAYAKSNKTSVQSLSQRAKDTLLNHSFPGNVRELRSIIELACVLADGKQIKKEHLQIQKTNNLVSPFEEELTVKEYTIMAVQQGLKKYDNNVKTVAQKLGISRSKVYKIIKESSIS